MKKYKKYKNLKKNNEWYQKKFYKYSRKKILFKFSQRGSYIGDLIRWWYPFFREKYEKR